MKKITKVLLVIGCLIFTLCGCGRVSESEATDNSETFEGLSYMFTDNSNLYEQFLYSSDVNGYEIVDIRIEGLDSSNLEYHVRYDEDANIRNEEICQYIVCNYDSLSEYEDDTTINEKLETGQYEILNETVLDSGECILTFKEKFEVAKSKDAEDEYSFTTSDSTNYLKVLQLLLENLKYEIVDIEIKDSTYFITYRTTKEMSITTSENFQMYALYTCTISEAEEFRDEFLKTGFEILDESADIESLKYVFTIRKVN